MSMTLPSLFLAVVLTVLLVATTANAAQCYHLDGSKADSTHQPCNPNEEVSACCALEKGGPDICLSSGLCYAQEPNHRGLIYSNGCTDPTGESEKCPKFGPDRRDGWDGGSEAKAWNILQCNALGSFCYRAPGDRENCCENSTATADFNIGTLVLHTTTVTATGTGTAAANTHGPSSSQADCPADKTALVGGAVGGALGAALIASVIVIVVMWKRRGKSPVAVDSLGKGTEHFGDKIHHQHGYTIQELDARSGRWELQGN